VLAHAVVQTVFDGPKNRGRDTNASPLDAMVDLRGLNQGMRNQALPGRRIWSMPEEEDFRPWSLSWNRFVELVAVMEVLFSWLGLI